MNEFDYFNYEKPQVNICQQKPQIVETSFSNLEIVASNPSSGGIVLRDEDLLELLQEEEDKDDGIFDYNQYLT